MVYEITGELIIQSINKEIENKKNNILSITNTMPRNTELDSEVAKIQDTINFLNFKKSIIVPTNTYQLSESELFNLYKLLGDVNG